MAQLRRYTYVVMTLSPKPPHLPMNRHDRPRLHGRERPWDENGGNHSHKQHRTLTQSTDSTVNTEITSFRKERKQGWREDTNLGNGMSSERSQRLETALLCAGP